MNVSVKGGEMMRAIDILFNEIDKINSEIKKEELTFNKVMLAFKIRKIVDIIEEMDKLQQDDGSGYIPKDFWYCEKDYI